MNTASLRSLVPFLACLFLYASAAELRAEEQPALGIELPATDDGLPGAGPIRRHDWFKQVWTQRRSAWAKQVEQDQKAVVFLGDSITHGWGDTMGNSFPGMQVANRGIGGDTTRGMLIRLKDDVLSLNPSAVVLMMGTNDLADQASPEIITGNVKLIIAALKKHNDKLPIILCQVFPSSPTKERPADKIKALNQQFFEAIKGDPQVTRVETWPLFANAEGDAKIEEFPDLLHPNELGYAKWAAALRPIFATLGFLETDDDQFSLEPGAISLFNGQDLSGWGFRDQQTQAQQANFDGQTTSSDGRYIALHGRIVVSTPPEGRRVQQMWTTKEFPKNFTLKLDFRATPNADSGVFIRSPQLQCRDYPLAGPYKELKSYKPQDWNELVVVVKDKVAHCTCNGEVLEAALPLPETGPIGLEGDNGQMEYRRIRLIEMP